MPIVRSDGWFKSSTGAAIVGAQVYVLTQPANTTLIAPQATLYSDPGGIVPLTQPLITDAFGHYYFYVNGGTYTILISLNGTTQQVYTDQSIGGAVTTLLETNSVANTFQATLNLIQGTNIGLVTNGAGGVTITVTSIDLTFAVQPSWWMSGDGSNYPFKSGAAGGRLGSSPANAVKFWMVRIYNYITISRLSLVNATAVAGSFGGFGLYNNTGTIKLFSWDNINTAVVGLQSFTLPSSIFVPPGTYMFACANSSAVTDPFTEGGYQTLQSSDTSQPWNALHVRSGIGTTVLSGAGAMPSTLGTLATNTALSLIPCVCMQS